jgi:hypothetical protein
MKYPSLILLIAALLGGDLRHRALAADIFLKASSPNASTISPAYDWSGLYLGAHIGGAWSNNTLTDSNTGSSWNTGGPGFLGGFQAGYNLVAGNFLYGIEGDFDWATFVGRSNPIISPLGTLEASARRDWISTVAARFGITSNRLLLYGKLGGGWARSSVGLHAVEGGSIWSGAGTDSGWLVGGGME